MDIERLIWDDLPTYYVPGEAWAFVRGAWMRVDSSEVNHDAWVAPEDVLRAKFQDLPPIPDEAFRKQREAQDSPSLGPLGKRNS